MKWINHQVVTGVAVYAFTGDYFLTASSMIGAIVPDKLEGNPRSGFSIIRKISGHRGWSHAPLIYFFLQGLLYKIRMAHPMLFEGFDITMLGQFFFVGALLHIAEDALCGKVPLLTPRQKIGVKLFKVGSVAEYVVTLILILIFYLINKNFL